MRTKRRLLYVPDEEGALLGELSDSPRPRPSRLSKLPILSSDRENGNSSVDNHEDTQNSEVIDSSLFVSYNSYTMADGSGILFAPSTSREAAALCRSLKKCCRFLNKFIQRSSISETSTDPLSSLSSSSSSSASEYSESFDYESDLEPRRRIKKKVKQKDSIPYDGDYTALTVLELRELLRKRNLPISGAKALLISRLEGNDKILCELEDLDKCDNALPDCADAGNSEGHSFFSIESENESKTSTFWGSLVNMGSKLFRKSTGSLPDDNMGSMRKRRRSV